MTMLRLRVMLCVLAFSVVASAQAPIKLSLDATDMGRGLLKATMEFSAPAEDFVLRYPQWIQGTHAPSGPVQNMGGLKFFGDDGEPVPWERDPLDAYIFHVKPPTGTKTLKAELVYLCNQPSVNSEGVDSQGNAWLGIVNWNTVALYPEGADCNALPVRASVTLPATWKLATALPQESRDGSTVHFSEYPFAQVMDSPLLMGEYLRSIMLASVGLPPVHMHLASEAEAAIQIPQSLIDTYSHVGTEAGLMFGGAPFDQYHYLVTCSNQIGGNGLEHSRSSFNGVGERDLLDEKQLRGWVGYLLPHEFVHAWCGKYRRPVGMVRSEFHSPMDTSLLWSYEGLTQYLGLVLCVRSGLWTLEHYRQALASDLVWMMGRTGRDWRSLEDTARASHLLRAHSPAWTALRRGQDYYDEGALWWMEADAVIRLESGGTRSLDDFCARFFGPANGAEPVIPYAREDLMTALNETQAYDWRAFFYERVNQLHDHLPAEFAGRLGYRLEGANTISAAQREDEETGNYINELYSIGAAFNADGTVRSNIVPGMAAEKAGLQPRSKVVAVDNRAFTKERLRDAIAGSVAARKIDLLTLDGDTYKTYTLEYADGPKFLTLVRDPARPDVLEQIMKARREVK